MCRLHARLQGAADQSASQVGQRLGSKSTRQADADQCRRAAGRSDRGRHGTARSGNSQARDLRRRSEADRRRGRRSARRQQPYGEHLEDFRPGRRGRLRRGPTDDAALARTGRRADAADRRIRLAATEARPSCPFGHVAEAANSRRPRSGRDFIVRTPRCRTAVEASRSQSRLEALRSASRTEPRSARKQSARSNDPAGTILAPPGRSVDLVT